VIDELLAPAVRWIPLTSQGISKMIDETLPVVAVEVPPQKRKGVGERRDVVEILNEDGDRLLHWCLRYKVNRKAIANALKTGMSYEDIIQATKLQLLKLKTVLAHFKQSTVICSALRWAIYRICERSKQKGKLPELHFIGRGDFTLQDSCKQEDAESHCLAHAAIVETVSRLHPKDRQVIVMRYGLDGNPEMTLAEIGKALGVTRERIRQIEARAMSRLRHPALVCRLEEMSA
jgi:RNA polymerase sigma factor (sigma-70 family)